jgi:acyl-CoA thioester hydrolase
MTGLANMLPMTTIRVAFADTDAMGIVHHANYLRYFEVARVEWFRERGIIYNEWQAQGRHLPLVESQCRYKKPARFDDILEVSVQPQIDGVRITLQYEVFNQKTKDLLATGFTQHVCVDQNLRVMPLPNELKSVV